MLSFGCLLRILAHLFPFPPLSIFPAISSPLSSLLSCSSSPYLPFYHQLLFKYSHVGFQTSSLPATWWRPGLTSNSQFSCKPLAAATQMLCSSCSLKPGKGAHITASPHHRPTTTKWRGGNTATIHEQFLQDSILFNSTLTPFLNPTFFHNCNIAHDSSTMSLQFREIMFCSITLSFKSLLTFPYLKSTCKYKGKKLTWCVLLLDTQSAQTALFQMVTI